MRLSTLRLPTGGTAAARQQDDDLVLLPHADVGDLLSSGADWDRAARHDGPRTPARAAVLPPLVPHPNKIVCLGLNYATHIAEMGRPTPAHPTLFAKYDGALIGDRADIHMPAVSDELDWEAELGVVIGRPARHVTADRALDHVAGYTVVNDVTVRDWQHRTREFLSGKTFESTTPVGPALVTTDELPAGAAGLDIGCSVDGAVMQQSNTADLLFDVADTIAYVSTIITLSPGDLIAMGTPGGVGAGRDAKVFLQPGQELVTWVEGIGQLRNVVVRDELPPTDVQPQGRREEGGTVPGLNTEWISVTTDDGPMRVFVARPEPPTGRAVVVLQEAFGVNENIQNTARRLAAHGYLAMAPDLFHRTGPEVVPYDDHTQAMALISQLGTQQITTDITAALTRLRDVEGIELARTGIVGFCFGGRAAFTAATATPGLGAAVVFYGPGIAAGPHAVLDRAGSVTAPVLMHVGAEDPSIPAEQVAAIDDAMSSIGSVFAQHIYGGAGHAFACEARPAMYRQEQAAAAWARTDEFLDRHLQSAA